MVGRPPRASKSKINPDDNRLDDESDDDDAYVTPANLEESGDDDDDTMEEDVSDGSIVSEMDGDDDGPVVELTPELIAQADAEAAQAEEEDLNSDDDDVEAVTEPQTQAAEIGINVKHKMMVVLWNPQTKRHEVTPTELIGLVHREGVIFAGNQARALKDVTDPTQFVVLRNVQSNAPRFHDYIVCVATRSPTVFKNTDSDVVYTEVPPNTEMRVTRAFIKDKNLMRRKSAPTKAELIQKAEDGMGSIGTDSEKFGPFVAAYEAKLQSKSTGNLICIILSSMTIRTMKKPSGGVKKTAAAKPSDVPENNEDTPASVVDESSEKKSAGVEKKSTVAGEEPTGVEKKSAGGEKKTAVAGDEPTTEPDVDDRSVPVKKRKSKQTTVEKGPTPKPAAEKEVSPEKDAEKGSSTAGSIEASPKPAAGKGSSKKSNSGAEKEASAAGKGMSKKSKPASGKGPSIEVSGASTAGVSESPSKKTETSSAGKRPKKRPAEEEDGWTTTSVMTSKKPRVPPALIDEPPGCKVVVSLEFSSLAALQKELNLNGGTLF